MDVDDKEDKLRALSALSNVSQPLDFSAFASAVKKAPDPETAFKGLLNQVPVSSDVLRRKWQNFITDVWFSHHPHAAQLPQWHVTAEEAAASPLLRDAVAYLDEISAQPPLLIEEQREMLISASDLQRLANALPSRLGLEPLPVENEWGIVELRRLRAILQTLRLVRTLKGRLVPVRSRIDRFNALPAAQQFYLLWHADVYHTDWHGFAGLWSRYMQVMQEYLSLLWETMEGAQAGVEEDRALWSVSVLETFLPVWDEEGMLDLAPGQGATLQVVQQQALPTIIDRFILRDLFERHGLVTIKEEFGHLSKFTWTALGAKVVAAEAGQELPCALALLDIPINADQLYIDALR